MRASNFSIYRLGQIDPTRPKGCQTFLQWASKQTNNGVFLVAGPERKACTTPIRPSSVPAGTNILSLISSSLGNNMSWRRTQSQEAKQLILRTYINDGLFIASFHPILTSHVRRYELSFFSTQEKAAADLEMGDPFWLGHVFNVFLCRSCKHQC